MKKITQIKMIYLFRNDVSNYLLRPGKKSEDEWIFRMQEANQNLLLTNEIGRFDYILVFFWYPK